MKTYYFTIWLLFIPGLLLAQNSKELKVFYDCQTNCFQTFIKQNLNAVEFVREPRFANVHIQITSETNGSGGETYHLEFIGMNDMSKINHEYSFATNNDMTQEIIRKKLLKFIKIGLVDYWSKNGMEDNIEISIKASDKMEEKDKWNNWILKLGMNGWFNGNSNSSNRNLNGYISVKQVKEKHKFYFKLQYGTNKQKFIYNNRKIVSDKQWFTIKANEVLSINQHWSYGFFGRYLQSKYSNYVGSIRFSTGIEYNIFPYKENAKKSLVFSTIVGGLYNRYYEKTIYNKTNEFLPQSSSTISGSFVQKWGNLYASVTYTTFLHDLKLNSFDFDLGTSVRITKGLNFNFYGGYSINHDQINIAAGNLSLSETLLAQKELQSGYNYYLSVGLNYSIGSIYNTIVNPRFDASNGNGNTCICF